MFFRETIFRGKVDLILKREFDYEINPDFQGQSLRSTCKLTRKRGGNEYDAALIFMLVQLEILGESSDTRDFRIKHAVNCIEVGEKAILPDVVDGAVGYHELIMNEVM